MPAIPDNKLVLVVISICICSWPNPESGSTPTTEPAQPVPTERSLSPAPSTKAEVKKGELAKSESLNIDPEVEKKLLLVLCDFNLDIPSESKTIAEMIGHDVQLAIIEELLQKFDAQHMIK